jgi:hypothetical protein
MNEDLTKLPKEQLLDRLEAEYTKFKPLNDQTVSVQENVLAIHEEIYGRLLRDRLPDCPIARWKKVGAISCSINYKSGLPKLAQRIKETQDAGVPVVAVIFDETMREFQLFAQPEKT